MRTMTDTDHEVVSYEEALWGKVRARKLEYKRMRAARVTGEEERNLKKNEHRHYYDDNLEQLKNPEKNSARLRRNRGARTSRRV